MDIPQFFSTPQINPSSTRASTAASEDSSFDRYKDTKRNSSGGATREGNNMVVRTPIHCRVDTSMDIIDIRHNLNGFFQTCISDYAFRRILEMGNGASSAKYLYEELSTFVRDLFNNTVVSQEEVEKIKMMSFGPNNNSSSSCIEELFPEWWKSYLLPIISNLKVNNNNGNLTATPPAFSSFIYYYWKRILSFFVDDAEPLYKPHGLQGRHQLKAFLREEVIESMVSFTTTQINDIIGRGTNNNNRRTPTNNNSNSARERSMSAAYQTTPKLMNDMNSYFLSTNSTSIMN